MVYDTDSIHDNATNNTRLTVPSGVTKVKIKGGLKGTASQRHLFHLFKNGSSAFIGNPKLDISDVNLSEMFLSSPVLDVTASDYFEFNVYPTPASTVVDQTGLAWFSMEIIE